MYKKLNIILRDKKKSITKENINFMRFQGALSKNCAKFFIYLQKIYLCCNSAQKVIFFLKVDEKCHCKFNTFAQNLIKQDFCQFINDLLINLCMIFYH